LGLTSIKFLKGSVKLISAVLDKLLKNYGSKSSILICDYNNFYIANFAIWGVFYEIYLYM